ncbi:MAG: hypothetical protein WD768_20380 [Phycisphaeraceae bacterium]
MPHVPIPPPPPFTRRHFLASAAALAAAAITHPARAADAPTFSLATFKADVTPPLGHALMGGGIAPAAKVIDPLEARGFILLSTDAAMKPIVVVAIDWCEIRNDAYERWREVLAEATGTDKQHVLVMAIHQHDAPIADLTAQRMLEEAKARGSICDLKFHEEAVQRVAKAAKESLRSPRRITHLGTGQAEVKEIASNRRYLDDDGKPRYDRFSATRDASIRARPEGDVDPFLKTLSFFDGDKPVLALSAYATHPMSYYGRGGISGDFVGMARSQREKDEPGVFQMYVSGCSGNVTAGKYNDGSTENRAVLADKLHDAMKRAAEATKRSPLTQVKLRLTPMKLKPREGEGFSTEHLQNRLKHDRTPFGQCLAALGLSWRMHAEKESHAIDVPAIDFGAACFLLMPAESYVEFQLAAQKLRPKDFVLVAGYGECGPGYIPIERAWRENDGNLSDWCWVAPGAEKVMMEAMEKVLKQVSAKAQG